MTTTWEEVNKILQKKNYIVAEKKAIAAIKKNPIDFQMWVVLSEALIQQKYYLDGYLILERVRIADPQATWVHSRLEEVEELLEKTKPLKLNFNEILGLQRVLVTAAMIVKNDVENVKVWVERIRGAVDRIVVIDTGSTDGTLNYLATQSDVFVVQSSWDDNFAKARNAATPFYKADWVIWIDSDEFLTEREKALDSIRFVTSLYEKLDSKPVMKVVHLNEMNGDVKRNYDVSRIFSTREGIQWHGRIHEQLGYIKDGMYSDLPRVGTGIEFEHSGYEPTVMQAKNKLARNIELLKRSAEEDPDNPLWWSFLGRETRLTGALDEALEYLETAEEKAKHQPGFGRLLETYDNMLSIYQHREDREKMKEVIQKMLETDPNYPNAKYLQSAMKLEDALEMLKEVIAETDAIKDACATYRGNVTPDENIGKYKADLLKADAFRLTGEFIQALKIYEDVYSRYPHENIQAQIDFLHEQAKTVYKKTSTVVETK